MKKITLTLMGSILIAGLALAQKSKTTIHAKPTHTLGGNEFDKNHKPTEKLAGQEYNIKGNNDKQTVSKTATERKKPTNNFGGGDFGQQRTKASHSERSKPTNHLGGQDFEKKPASQTRAPHQK
jgi:hypothetical protein